VKEMTSQQTTHQVYVQRVWDGLLLKKLAQKRSSRTFHAKYKVQAKKLNYLLRGDKMVLKSGKLK
jgi:hypothetical protein